MILKYGSLALILSRFKWLALVRELAVRLFGAAEQVRREILLPGATGLESLRALDLHLHRLGLEPVIVLDNAHRISADSLRRSVTDTSALRFVLLCQPVGSIREVEVALSLVRENLNGWGLDEVASACTAAGAFGSAVTMGRVQSLTRGMPLRRECRPHSAPRLWRRPRATVHLD